jgi:transcription antitermination protein NusB
VTTLDPHKFRELVFLVLFSLDMGQKASDELFDLIMYECKVAKRHVLDASAKAEAIMKRSDECDALIKSVCEEYRIERIMNAERNILRLAIFELVLEPQLPENVVFSEAKRLTRKFSTKEAATFVHSLLGAIRERKSWSVA